MTELTIEEKATNYETLTHIHTVCELLSLMVSELIRRGLLHDKSKLGSVECPIFVEYTPKLRTSVYGSDEYKENLKGMSAALSHHYASNRHHPEYFGEAGINGMNLIDVIEMLMDWKAATLRHETGDLNKSVEINAGRFHVSEQLLQIIRNTVRDFGLQEWTPWR